MTTYKIIRFTFDENHPDSKRVIKTGLTLDEAQAWCSREDTHHVGDDVPYEDQWFDGYTEESNRFDNEFDPVDGDHRTVR